VDTAGKKIAWKASIAPEPAVGCVYRNMTAVDDAGATIGRSVGPFVLTHVCVVCDLAGIDLEDTDYARVLKLCFEPSSVPRQRKEYLPALWVWAPRDQPCSQIPRWCRYDLRGLR